MGLLVILSLFLKVISSVLSRLIFVLSWSFMDTFVDNKYNLWRGNTVSHKAPQDIFRDSSAFGGIVSSYFSGSSIDTYGVQYSKENNSLLPTPVTTQTLLLEEPPELFLLANFLDLESESDLAFLLSLTSLSIFPAMLSKSQISSVLQIVGVAPRRTRRDLPDVISLILQVKMESRKSQSRPKPSQLAKVVLAEKCQLQPEPTISDMIKLTLVLHG
ncbi:Folate-biopterin transporter 1, chloroplastic, partial [Mucuna pruriens]